MQEPRPSQNPGLNPCDSASEIIATFTRPMSRHSDNDSKNPSDIIENACIGATAPSAFVVDLVVRLAPYRPNSFHKLSTRCLTASSITIGRPHSRSVSPGHLLVASSPILDPKPATGDAKSR